MRKIPFQAALQLLDQTSIIRIHGRGASVEFELNTAEDEFFFLSLDVFTRECNSLGFSSASSSYDFRESDNAEVEIDDFIVRLTDHQGELVELELFGPMALEQMADSIPPP